MQNKMNILYSKDVDIIDMSHDRFANLLMIDIFHKDNRIPFVFDTGASITTISTTVADKIGAVSLSASVTVGGNSGKRKTVSKYLIPSIRLGSTFIENIICIVLPDEELDFGIDENENRLKINGFLGWDVIHKFKWIIDPILRNFEIYAPVISEEKNRLHWDNMPIIDVLFNNQPMHFGFDTGNTESMFGKKFIPFLESSLEKSDTIVGVGGIVKEEVYLINDIQLNIGGKYVQLDNISVLKRDVFPTKNFKVMGLLAADIIQNYKFIIDFINHDFQII
ncbi:aspartyl protease family protein [Anaerocolumna aminovalerica]|jgi:hypothetical protein|uniref:pepsin/retropepsin-like aspartic protease family protein n=1 Tax=Anaerocolumna aminovalerica TaxID=1527 RepID=UPI001C0EC975|nr:pepsin/retropepsin-like aspartic protease family protein [Anaerocolumna aminovalerica]MBU5332551.1 aspartyl protease family protein [Anaerocolumna aminovalerica]